MARSDERSKPTEKVPQREYDQSRGDGLGADHVTHLADTALRPVHSMLDLVRRLLNASGAPRRCSRDRVLDAGFD